MKRLTVLSVLALAAVMAVVGAGLLFSQEAAAPGVLVASVVSGAPADKAGITAGDRILSVDNKDVSMPSDVVRAIRSHKAGDRIELRIMSGDEEKTLSVVAEDRNGRPYIGVALAPALADLRRERRDERPKAWQENLAGAVIVQVAEGSPAEKAGLKPHDMILSVNGDEIKGQQALADLIGKHAAGDTVTLSVRSADRQQREVNITLAANPEKAGSAYLGVQYVAVPAHLHRNPLENPSEKYKPRSGFRGSDAL